jgi:hypothetical protein
MGASLGEKSVNVYALRVVGGSGPCRAYACTVDFLECTCTADNSRTDRALGAEEPEERRKNGKGKGGRHRKEGVEEAKARLGGRKEGGSLCFGLLERKFENGQVQCQMQVATTGWL